MCTRETERWKFDSRTAPPEAAVATENMTSTAARPIIFDASTSGTAKTDIKVSLIRSFAISGRPNSWANPVARVVLPLPGGPETTTKSGGWVIFPCCRRFACLHPGDGSERTEAQ